MTDENKSGDIDGGDDLLSDFNDLFPEEPEEDDLLNELDSGDEADLDSLLEGLDTPSQIPSEVSDAEETDDELDDLDSLLDSLDDSIDIGAEDDTQISETSAEEITGSGAEQHDLDSLLDDMEEHVEEIVGENDGDDLDSLLDEMVAESEPAPERELDIDENMLDLSVGDDEPEEVAENPVEETSLDVESSENMLDDLISDDEEPFSGDELDTAAAAAVTAAATAAAATESKREEVAAEPEQYTSSADSAQESEDKSAQAPSRAGAILVYLLLVIALSVAGGAIWMALEAQNAITVSNARIAKLQKQIEQTRKASEPTYNPVVDQNSSSIRDLDLRINELSRMVEGPLSHMGSSNTNEEVIGKLEEHLQQLEQSLSELKAEMAKRPTVVAATTSPPLMVKAPESAPKSEKQWALNLLSLSSRNGANDEVKRLQSAGVNASRNHFTAKDGRIWYRVRVTGFSSYEAAKAYAEEMPKLKGIDNTWVTPE